MGYGNYLELKFNIRFNGVCKVFVPNISHFLTLSRLQTIINIYMPKAKAAKLHSTLSQISDLSQEGSRKTLKSLKFSSSLINSNNSI